MTNRLAIMGGTVVTPRNVIEKGIVLCQDGSIRFVGREGEAAPEPGSLIIDAADKIVMPGFIDTHFHGSGGDDVMANGSEGIRRIAKALLKYGTTGFLATTIAARHEALLRSVEETIAAEKAEKNSPESSKILGLHIEGPYINPKFKGAQPERGIRDPDLAECRELLEAAEGRIKIMTLAPELPGGFELIRFLTAEGVAASLGHSDAEYDTALAAIEAGATRATHLYNAMSALHHRKPGLAAACLNEPGLQVELICDGVHVDPRMTQLAWRAKGPAGLTLITDATAAQGIGDGDYMLGEHQIKVRGPRCTLLDGVTLAGSVLTMNIAARNAMKFTEMNLTEAACAASLLPAQACGVADRKGSIEAGKDADIAVLHPDFAVLYTVRAGTLVYKSEI